MYAANILQAERVEKVKEGRGRNVRLMQGWRRGKTESGVTWVQVTGEEEKL